MMANKRLGVAVRLTLCPFFSSFQVFRRPPRRGGRGRLALLEVFPGGGRGKLLPDEGRQLGEWNLCPVSRQQPLRAQEGPVSLCLAYETSPVLRDLKFLLPTGGQRSEAGGQEAAADGFSVPGARASLSF